MVTYQSGFLLSMSILTLQAAMCPAAATSTVFALVTSVQMAGATLGDSLSALVTAPEFGS